MNGATTWSDAKLSETMKIYLVGLDQDEDVVHANSQHQERDDFNHNEGERDRSQTSLKYIATSLTLCTSKPVTLFEPAAFLPS